MGVASAIIGSALIGGYTSNKASKTAAKSAEKGMQQSTALADQSRTMATDLYNKARVSGQRGLTSAFDYYKNASKSKYSPFIQANTAAQGVIGQGAQQANNAILGLPVNMNFTQPQQVQPDMSFMDNAQLPQMTGEYLPAGGLPVQQQAAPQAQPYMGRAGQTRGIM